MIGGNNMKEIILNKHIRVKTAKRVCENTPRGYDAVGKDENVC
jgi:hypothetical protein